ncbi:MAG TPA: OmpA family protein [Acetobacteraceae bacterium]|nr:OmpA family protein [Acetobacteraceae bacterium]
MNPVVWWHDLQGGAIAQQRPPPPGANQPYPNLATIPPRPTPPDQKELAAITQGLVADRAHADYLAASSPVADPSSPTASPALFGQGTMPPPPAATPPTPAAGTASGSPGVASASLPAASAPPQPPMPANGIAPPPQAAPLRPVQSMPLSPPPGAAPPVQTASATPPVQSMKTAAPSQTAGTTGAAVPPGNATVATNTPLAPPGTAITPPPASAPPPPIPVKPPAPPSMAGPGAPAMTPPAKVAINVPPTPPRQANATMIEFVTGSATLPPGAAGVLKEIVAKRGSAVIAVTGYGDASSDDPAAQSAALSLGLARAQAVANVLTGDGVPQTAVRVGAEAAGRGASVRLVQ